MDSTLNVNPYQLLSQFDDSMNNSELIEFVEQNIKLKPKDRPSIDYQFRQFESTSLGKQLVDHPTLKKYYRTAEQIHNNWRSLFKKQSQSQNIVNKQKQSTLIYGYENINSNDRDLNNNDIFLINYGLRVSGYEDLVYGQLMNQLKNMDDYGFNILENRVYEEDRK